METEIESGEPREVVMEYAGIYYAETQNNKVFLNVVEKNNKIMLVLIINPDALGNEFHAMTFGKIIYSVPLLEVMQQAKTIETQELLNKGIQ